MTHAPPHIHVVTSIEEEASGPSYSVTRLAEAQAAQGLETGIFSLAATPGTHVQAGVNDVRFPASLTWLPGSKRLNFSSELRTNLDSMAQKGALLHVHGLWRLPNVYPGHAAARYGTPLGITAIGAVSP